MVTLRCEECQRPLIEGEGLFHYLAVLFTVVEVLEAEEAITPATAKLMWDKLSWLSGPVREHDEDVENNEHAKELKELQAKIRRLEKIVKSRSKDK